LVRDGEDSVLARGIADVHVEAATQAGAAIAKGDEAVTEG
jgi:hypothetical protein